MEIIGESINAWDYSYEVACNIIQTFDKHYPSPTVDVIVQSLKSGSIRANSNKLDDVIEWAKNYAEKWYEENVK